MRPLFILALALLASDATAEPRFHRLTQKLEARLRPQTRKALRAVAQVHNASGFVVADDGEGRGLLLTNAHVARNGIDAGEPVRFFDGRSGQTVRLLTMNPRLDYALVEVALPSGPSRAIAIDRSELVPRQRIYTLAGYANLWFTRPWRGLAGGARANQELLASPTFNQFAIANGHLGSDATPIDLPGRNGPIHGVETVLPNGGGMSGSPVLSTATHAAIALHSSGNASPDPWAETAIPLRLVLEDLGSFRAPDEQAGRLVDRLRAP